MVMPKKLDQHATLISICSTLKDDEYFIRCVRHEMKNCLKANGNSFVRIGITGMGVQPCYRIFFKSNENAKENIVGSYWYNHKALENEKAINMNWSSNSSSFEEIDAFYQANYSSPQTRVPQ